MAKFRKGDRVRYLGGMCAIKIGALCEIDESDSEYPAYHTLEGVSHRCTEPEEHFELVKIGDSMNVGDILANGSGKTIKVLAYINQGVELVLVSEYNDHDCVDNWYLVDNLKLGGWKLKTDETVEKSVAEIEKELGLASGTLRVKKDN